MKNKGIKARDIPIVGLPLLCSWRREYYFSAILGAFGNKFYLGWLGFAATGVGLLF